MMGSGCWVASHGVTPPDQSGWLLWGWAHDPTLFQYKLIAGCLLGFMRKECAFFPLTPPGCEPGAGGPQLTSTGESLPDKEANIEESRV